MNDRYRRDASPRGELSEEDGTFLAMAVDEAQRGWDEGGIPIGSVIVHDGQVIGRGHNRRVQQGSPTLHGEMDALEQAGRLPAEIYRNSVIYTTLSPCSMCSGAILLYGIPRVVVGENATFLGEEELLRIRGVEVVVADDPQCRELMERMIAERPDEWFEDIGTTADD
jgi:cytosine deaminase